MKERLTRLDGLFLPDATERLGKAKVAVFGLGGVGGFAAEALARSGVGNLILVDCDEVKESNLNRQIFATGKTIGVRKTDCAKTRILEIAPEINITVWDAFYEGGSDMFCDAEVIIDAIDTVSAKLNLIAAAKENNIPIVSCMGTGNKLDLTKLRVADIFKTKACPLARVMRKELRLRGVSDVKVVYSEEEPKHLTVGDENGRHPPMSAIFVPAAAGLLLASEALKYLGAISNVITKDDK